MVPLSFSYHNVKTSFSLLRQGFTPVHYVIQAALELAEMFLPQGLLNVLDYKSKPPCPVF